MTTPVEWVEQQFDTQTVWQQYKTTDEEMAGAMDAKAKLTGQLRVAQAKLDEAESLVINEYLGSVGSLAKPPSQAAIDREIKARVSNDGACKALRDAILTLRIRIDDADSQVEVLKLRSRALMNRMSVIAAELRFYATCKEAETTARRLSMGNPAVNWPF